MLNKTGRTDDLGQSAKCIQIRSTITATFNTLTPTNKMICTIYILWNMIHIRNKDVRLQLDPPIYTREIQSRKYTLHMCVHLTLRKSYESPNRIADHIMISESFIMYQISIEIKHEKKRLHGVIILGFTY